jgi:hypothetical protein
MNKIITSAHLDDLPVVDVLFYAVDLLFQHVLPDLPQQFALQLLLARLPRPLLPGRFQRQAVRGLQSPLGLAFLLLLAVSFPQLVLLHPQVFLRPFCQFQQILFFPLASPRFQAFFGVQLASVLVALRLGLQESVAEGFPALPYPLVLEQRGFG